MPMTAIGPKSGHCRTALGLFEMGWISVRPLMADELAKQPFRWLLHSASAPFLCCNCLAES